VEPVTGRVVLITGAARRIGREIALRLGREGARVGIHYASSERDARATAAECGGELFRANLESVDEIIQLFADVGQRFGRLDALVNNAARFTRQDPMDVTESDWDFLHSVNLKAVFFCCQQGAKLMRQNGGGHIVNISSLGGLRPWPDHVPYCASKAGVIHMTRALAVALAPGISVNSVAPGVIPFEEADDPEIRSFVARTPAKRAGTGADIAEAVLQFLSSSKFVTGQTLAVDGGFGLR
jgi:NAD(P)-dependent dehydrogenase (short-subunit alcohol dehydrogenase family)